MTTMLRDIADRANASEETAYRSYELDEFAFRDDGPTGFTFEGVASVVEKPYKVRDKFGEYTEVIRTGAFNKTLRDGSAFIGLYVNHGHRWGQVPLATRGAGTLKITADPNLRVSADLDPARPDVQIVASAIRRGEMRQMSVGFNHVKARDAWNADWTQVERGEVILKETSIVELGASSTTTASMRSFDEFMESLTDIEMSEDDIRRAIAGFEARLPAPETNQFELRDRDDLERLAHRRRQLVAV